MKYFAFLSLILLFAACKKEDCEPMTIHSTATYLPTKKDSIQHLWLLDSGRVRMFNTPDSIIMPLPPLRYASFSANTLFYNIMPGVFYISTPYTVNVDTVFVDYSLPFVPTDFYLIDRVTATNLELSYRSPADTSRLVTLFLTKQ
jgi:hypothetical protein